VPPVNLGTLFMQDVSADGRLVLDGSLTVRNAVAVCTTLRETITQHRVVSIDCTAADAVDLSFIQLLIASRTSASALGNSISLAEYPDGVLLSALTRSGFHVTTDNRTEAKSFWFEGAAE
jgi:ABC-type transporter Mla MlaB component